MLRSACSTLRLRLVCPHRLAGDALAIHSRRAGVYNFIGATQAQRPVYQHAAGAAYFLYMYEAWERWVVGPYTTSGAYMYSVDSTSALCPEGLGTSWYYW